METIHIHHPYDPQKLPSEEIVLVLGFFDGLHRGHQTVISKGREIAKQKKLKLAVMTFNQHPSIVFQKVKPETMRYLTTLERKEQLMAELETDYLYVVEFTSAFASLKPQEFVDQYMVGLNAQVVVAGFDYTYGPRELATMENLPNYAQERFEIVTVPKQTEAANKISSTHIREFMDQGKMTEVTNYLGYVYQTEGVVVHGDARGRTLGFPTANLQIDREVRLPKVGVYAVKIKVAEKWFLGMASIGYNITFEKDRGLTVEVNILDFDADIYGEQVLVEWYYYLRPELRFDGREELIKQLEQDEVDTRDYFKERG